MFSKGKVLMSLAAMSVIATGTVGCTDDDFAVIGGTIAVVAGVVAIDHATDRDHRDHDRDHDRGPGHGGPGGGWGPGGPGRPPGRFAATVKASSAFAASKTDVAVKQVASKYGLPLQSAERLTAVLQDAASGKTSALAEMGLSNSELSRVAQYNLPSDAALDQVGSSLAMSREMARGLVQQLMNETRVQMADVTSPAWTACQATGKWKTDANGGTCKSTDWKGCSPAMGATICAAVN